MWGEILGKMSLMYKTQQEYLGVFCIIIYQGRKVEVKEEEVKDKMRTAGYVQSE